MLIALIFRARYKVNMSDICCMITDNGSYRPESTFSLRDLAKRLGEKVGHEIHAVSLLHSIKIHPDKLEGIPAEIFEPFVIKKREEGVNRFLVTPMFFGPSAAIMEYIPQRVEALKAELNWPELEVRVAPCVVDLEDPSDTRMAQVLVDQIEKAKVEAGFSKPSVVVVDHGAPRIKVTEVRNHVTEQVKAILSEKKGDYAEVVASSMERREGDEYAFNEPLLENVLGTDGFKEDVIISMLFASPGRHAGPGGDVFKICEESSNEASDLNWVMTDLVAKHPLLMDLLTDRFHEGMASDPVFWNSSES